MIKNQIKLDLIYRSVFEECRKYNIEPLVQWHFDTLALEENYGGWKNRKLIDFYFAIGSDFQRIQRLGQILVDVQRNQQYAMFLDMFGAKATDDYQRLPNSSHQFVASAKAVNRTCYQSRL